MPPNRRARVRGGATGAAEPLFVFASCENERCTAAGLPPPMAPAGGRSFRGPLSPRPGRYLTEKKRVQRELG